MSIREFFIPKITTAGMNGIRPEKETKSDIILKLAQEFKDHSRKDVQKWRQAINNDFSLVKDFSTLWTNLRSTYQNELTPLAFSEIPNEKLVEKSFMEIIKKL